MSEEPKTPAAKAALRKRINARRIRTTAVAIASVLGIPVVLLQLINLSCDTLGLFCVAKSSVEQSASAPAAPEDAPQARPLSPAPTESPAPALAQNRPEESPSPMASATPASAASASPVALPPTAVPNRAWLGIRVEPVTDSMARELFMPAAHGARVTFVASDGPGDRAGLKSGDVISAFDGRIVQTTDDLRRMLEAADPKLNATVEVIRKGLHSFITVEFSSAAPAGESGLF